MAQSVCLIGALPLYDRISKRLPRRSLLWVGIFNVFIVAQFWSFAADLYSEESGKRLFPLIAIGATAGAASGAWMAKRLVGSVGTLRVAAGGGSRCWRSR